jgi:hypothetical protein
VTFHAIRLGDGALGVLELSDAWPRRAHVCAVCGTGEGQLRRLGRGAAEDVDVLVCRGCDSFSTSN